MGAYGEHPRFTNHLTSSIKEGDYLTRREAPPNSHKVTLGFSTGMSIFRSAITKPAQSMVIELLKRPEWGAKIEDIATYLAFTHFLGQAAQQRFTSLERNEQWEALKGPSGMIVLRMSDAHFVELRPGMPSASGCRNNRRRSDRSKERSPLGAR